MTFQEIAEYCDLPHIPKKAEDEWKQRFDELMEKLLVKFRVSSTSMVDTPAFTLPNTLGRNKELELVDYNLLHHFE